MKFRNLLLTSLGLCTLSSLAFASSFPVTINTKFGPVTIAKEPHRVATVDYAGADDLLALGVQPVTVRYWYGDYPRAVWPWADKVLTGNPAIIKSPIDIELIAQQKPDVILAIWSGITEAEYKKLSAIAPVVAVPAGIGDFDLKWDERALLAGKVIGKEELAQEKIDQINHKFQEVKMAHPHWAGKTFTVGGEYQGAIGAYTSASFLSKMIAKFGLETNSKLDALQAYNGYASISLEQINLLDADVLLWLSSTPDHIKDIKGRQYLSAVKDHREIILDTTLGGAVAHASLLSIPYVIDTLTPQIEKVLKK